jgi:hypothetical protein
MEEVIDQTRLELYKDRNAAESTAVEKDIDGIFVERGGTKKKSISLPRGTRKSQEAILREITRFLTQFQLWVEAGGLAALVIKLKPLVEKWLENRAGRSARIKLGDVEVELKGEGVDKAVEVAEKLAAKWQEQRKSISQL